MNKKIKLAIFASGGGSNAVMLEQYFRQHNIIEIAVFLTNRHDSGVIKLAKKHNKPLLIFTNHELKNTSLVEDFLTYNGVDLIVLAGFLLKIPEYLIERFPDRILNIHPALLPKYGGKGMYGHFVHEAVKAAGDTESITCCSKAFPILQCWILRPRQLSNLDSGWTSRCPVGKGDFN